MSGTRSDKHASRPGYVNSCRRGTGPPSGAQGGQPTEAEAEEPLEALLTCEEAVPAATAGAANRAACALTALVGPAARAGLGQGVDDAVGACRLDVVDGTGKGGESPQQAADGPAPTATTSVGSGEGTGEHPDEAARVPPAVAHRQ